MAGEHAQRRPKYKSGYAIWQDSSSMIQMKNGRLGEHQH